MINEKPRSRSKNDGRSYILCGQLKNEHNIRYHEVLFKRSTVPTDNNIVYYNIDIKTLIFFLTLIKSDYVIENNKF